MINTLNIKEQQLVDGYFKVGSGPTNILVMGSCRVVNYVTYLRDLNDGRFTIYSIDPFSWNWDINGERTNYEEEIFRQEHNEKLLAMLSKVDIFIHEYYQNAGMFNCDKNSPKNIYQYGMNPKQDICIPNFNDLFILYNDIIDFDVELKRKVNQDLNSFGKISTSVKLRILDKSNKEIDKFLDICRKCDMEEMASYFINNFTKTRLWWTCNHVTREFTLAVFDIINSKYLHLDTSKLDRNHFDMFSSHYTELTEFDKELYGYTWAK